MANSEFEESLEEILAEYNSSFDELLFSFTEVDVNPNNISCENSEQNHGNRRSSSEYLPIYPCTNKLKVHLV